MNHQAPAVAGRQQLAYEEGLSPSSARVMAVKLERKARGRDP